MLDYIGWGEAASLITSAMEKLFSEGYATSDLARFMDNGKPLGTNEFAEKLANTL